MRKKTTMHDAYMLDPWIIVLLALVVNLPIGAYALRKKSLSFPDGAIAAGLVSILMFLAHPLYWFILMIFFGSSTLLTKFKEGDNVKKEAMSFAEKGGQRDALQVFANSGVPFVIAVLSLISFGFWEIELNHQYVVLFSASLAVANADTWATELGVTSTGDPRYILNPRKIVPRGTSGGVSPLGFFASLIASTLIAVVLLLGQVILGPIDWIGILLVVIGGFVGSAVDSLLGATVQAQFKCQECGKLTEKGIHHGKATFHEKGLSWFRNDLVNILSVVIVVLLLSFRR